MKFESTEVWGWEHALRGMRNPMNSWNKSDTMFEDCGFYIGENDMNLAQRLIIAGSEHRKFMRQIFVSVDITAPMYFMSELDTYKIGVTRNSSSFMHKGVSKQFEIEDFEHDDERIINILSIREIAKNEKILYPYETEEYKTYATFSGRQYQIYKNGRIFSLPFTYTDSKKRIRNFERREVKPSITKGGYWELNIGGRKVEKWLLHRLVAFVWLNNPTNLETVDHINCDKNDNSVENLQWVTREENIKRQNYNNLIRKNNIRADYLNWKSSSKVTPLQKIQIMKSAKDGVTQKNIAKKYPVNQSQISVIVRNAKNTSNNSDLFEQVWFWEHTLCNLNYLRDCYLESKDFIFFRMIRQLLPQSYLYRSTVTMTYENLYSMIRQRLNHKLNEWSGKDDNSRTNFISWCRTLPYADSLLFLGLEDNE